MVLYIKCADLFWISDLVSASNNILYIVQGDITQIVFVHIWGYLMIWKWGRRGHNRTVNTSLTSCWTTIREHLGNVGVVGYLVVMSGKAEMWYTMSFLWTMQSLDVFRSCKDKVRNLLMWWDLDLLVPCCVTGQKPLQNLEKQKFVSKRWAVESLGIHWLYEIFLSVMRKFGRNWNFQGMIYKLFLQHENLTFSKKFYLDYFKNI